MNAFALSAKPRAIARSATPGTSKRRGFLPESSSPHDAVDLTTSPDTKTTKRAAASLVPAYFSPKRSKTRSDGSEESLPTPPPTSSVHDAEADDGIEEVDECDFTPEELERSARKGKLARRKELTTARSRNLPSSSNVPSSASERSPLPRQPPATRSRTPRQPSPLKSKSRSASPAKQVTLDDLFNSQQEKEKEQAQADATPKAAPASRKRRLVAASDDEELTPRRPRGAVNSDDDVPLSRSRRTSAAAPSRAVSDDDAPLSVRRKGKARAIIPASDEDAPSSSSHAIDLCSSDPVDPPEDVPPPDEPGLRGPEDDSPDLDDYDDAFPWDMVPDEPDYSPAPPPEPATERRRPRQSIFDLPDFSNEPASQVPRSRSVSPVPPGVQKKGKQPAIKFADFSLLSELDENVRTFYEQHWRRGVGDEADEWHESDRLAFTAAPKRKAPAPRRGGWFKRARGRGRGRGRR